MAINYITGIKKVGLLKRIGTRTAEMLALFGIMVLAILWAVALQ